MNFGENFHPDLDAFNFTFGCVTTETNLFYTQEADGILGMTKSNSASSMMRPIFKIMKEKQLIPKEMFSLCLGKNGGYFQIGGYDGTNHIANEITWIPTWETHDYKFSLYGISFNNHLMSGSEAFNVGVVDSGTTFTYVPEKLFTMILIHFDWFCSLDTEHHCKGKRIRSEGDPNAICFEYNETLYPTGPKPYFLSYPVLNFHADAINNTRIAFKWYPSEYLFRH